MFDSIQAGGHVTLKELGHVENQERSSTLPHLTPKKMKNRKEMTNYFRMIRAKTEPSFIHDNGEMVSFSKKPNKEPMSTFQNSHISSNKESSQFFTLLLNIKGTNRKGKN